MSYADRIARIEARIMATRARARVPDAVMLYTADPVTVVMFAPEWPLREVKRWERPPGQHADDFLRCVLAEAPKGALLAEVIP